jgi:hypothetical protein
VAVDSWAPATEAEAAMRDVLRGGDQEHYFRVLARLELLLPVSADSAGRRSPGWGTWSSDGRTHVLAFTSPQAMRACLAEHAGSYRAVSFRELAMQWPNPDWWLAINPGLPIEGYLPSWFVSQISRGDVRLPGRGIGSRARMDHASNLRARAVAQVPRRVPAPGAGPAAARADQPVSGSPVSGSPVSGSPVSGQPVSGPPQSGPVSGRPGSGQPAPGQPGFGVPGPAQPRPGQPAPARPGIPQPAAAQSAQSGMPQAGIPQPGLIQPGPGYTGPAQPGPAGSGRPGAGLPGRPGSGLPSPGQSVPVRPGFGQASIPQSGVPQPGSPSAGSLRSGSPQSGSLQSGSSHAGSLQSGSSHAGSPQSGSPDAPVSPVPVGAPALHRPGGPGLRGPGTPPSAEPTAGSPPPIERLFGPDRAAPADAATYPRGRTLRDVERTRTPRGGFPPAVTTGPSNSVFTGAPPPAPPPAAPPPAAARPPAAPPPAFVPPPPPAPPGRLFQRDEPASGPVPPRVIDGEVSESRGLGARLAELQALSGGFAAVPVDQPDEPEPDWYEPPARPSRGIWEPKVPMSAPDEPDEAPAEPYAAEPRAAAAPYGAEPSAPAASYGAEPPAPAAPYEPAPYDAGSYDAGPYDAGPYDAGPSAAPAAPVTADDLPPLERITVEPTPAYAIREGIDPGIDLMTYEVANATEEDLLNATRAGNTDSFLSTLLLAKVLVPGHSPDPTQWPTEDINGGRYLVAYTSVERLTERLGAQTEPAPAPLRFTGLIARWPGDDLGFAVNPGTPVGATLSGDEVRTLAAWAAEVGLIDERDREPQPEEPAATPASEPTPAPAPVARPAAAAPVPGEPLMMQRTVAATQVPLYLERGYDRVSGFVHRASEVGHLRTPADLYRALGLVHAGSPFGLDDPEVYMLRWPAHCPSLYRIPFGGQTEAGMHAMQGWVIERAPFRGNGFAPSETSDVVAEFKVDSTRLPHGAQLWRVTRDGIETLIAMFDADAPRWRRVGDGDDA